MEHLNKTESRILKGWRKPANKALFEYNYFPTSLYDQTSPCITLSNMYLHFFLVANFMLHSKSNLKTFPKSLQERAGVHISNKTFSQVKEIRLGRVYDYIRPGLNIKYFYTSASVGSWQGFPGTLSNMTINSVAQSVSFSFPSKTSWAAMGDGHSV